MITVRIASPWHRPRLSLAAGIFPAASACDWTPTGATYLISSARTCGSGGDQGLRPGQTVPGAGPPSPADQRPLARCGWRPCAPFRPRLRKRNAGPQPITQVGIPASRYPRMATRREPTRVLAMTTPGHSRVKLDGKDRHHPELLEGAGCHSYGSPGITGRPGHAGAVRWSRYCHSTLETPTSPVPSNCSANRGSRVVPGRAENDLRAGPGAGMP